jgi:hypothetical protein
MFMNEVSRTLLLLALISFHVFGTVSFTGNLIDIPNRRNIFTRNESRLSFSRIESSTSF